MHTNSTLAFARPGRLTPDDMSLGDEARAVWLVVLESDSLFARLTRTVLRHVVYRLRRKNDRSDPLEIITRVIVVMAAIGYPESAVALIPAHINSVIARCYTGNAHRSLQELDREECALEAEENALTIERLTAGDAITSEQLEREAICNEREATLQFERAKELRRLAGQTRVLQFKRPFARPMGVVS